MEELLKQAWQGGQEWAIDVHKDYPTDGPVSFNEWYASDEVQEKIEEVKNKYWQEGANEAQNDAAHEIRENYTENK